MQQLVNKLQVFGASIEQQTSDYVYAVLDQGSARVMDLEFVFAPSDTTVGCAGDPHVAATSFVGLQRAPDSSRRML